MGVSILSIAIEATVDEKIPTLGWAATTDNAEASNGDVELMPESVASPKTLSELLFQIEEQYAREGEKPLSPEESGRRLDLFRSEVKSSLNAVAVRAKGPTR